MNKEALFAKAIKPIKIEVAPLGEVHIRELSYKGACEVASRHNPIDRSVFTLIYGLCDESGKLIFTPEDLNEIADSFSFATIQTIALEVSKITNVAPDKLVKSPAAC
ncbi:MAG: hypothetical protein ACRC2Y_04830 [Aeromonas veronii]